MPKRQQAADYFSPEPVTDQLVPKKPPVEVAVVIEGGPAKVRRSGWLQSSPAVSTSTRTTRRTVLKMGQAAKKMSEPLDEIEVLSMPKIGKPRKLSGGSHNADDFAGAPEAPNATPSVYPKLDTLVLDKSPVMEDQYVSAVEDVGDATNGEIEGVTTGEGMVIPDSLDEGDVLVSEDGEEVISDVVTPQPSTTQNTLEAIPSSQPRPSSQRSPVPLQPVPSSPAASFPTSTEQSLIKSTSESAAIPLDEEISEGSDDEAPEAIPLSQSRSQALQSQSLLSLQTKAQAEKVREKRRQRDQLLAIQKQEKRLKREISDSQQSTGNTTDTPAPNQDHQASRVARHAKALPTSILQAASATWLQPDPEAVAPQKLSKKRKEPDDGVRILEEMNTRLAPQAGKIGTSKEKLIMRLGRGERRMFVGRFAR